MDLSKYLPAHLANSIWSTWRDLLFSKQVLRIGILVTKVYGPVMRNILLTPKRKRYLRSVRMVGLRSYDHGRLELLQKFYVGIPDTCQP